MTGRDTCPGSDLIPSPGPEIIVYPSPRVPTHYYITKRDERSDERRVDLIFNLEGDLMIPRVAIQEA
jgi:hypothetical protein